MTQTTAATTKPDTVTSPTAFITNFAPGHRHFGNQDHSIRAKPTGMREKTIAIASVSSAIVNGT